MLQKALEIDDSLSEIYSSLAFMIMAHEWDFPAAEKHLRHSIELNPHNGYAHILYGLALSFLNRRDEAIAEAQKAVESDPLFSLFHAMNGIVLTNTGEVEKGREQLLKAIAMDPDLPVPYLFLGMAFLVAPAAPEKAIEYLEKAAGSGMAFAYGWLGAAHAMRGREDEAERILTKLENFEKESFFPPLKKLLLYLKPGLRYFRFMSRKYVSPIPKAMIHMALNRPEEAMEFFEQAAQARDYFLPIMLTGSAIVIDLPWMNGIRSHPRFMALQEKITLK
jgi:tetratricopeptide (TPR) repeat protein